MKGLTQNQSPEAVTGLLFPLAPVLFSHPEDHGGPGPEWPSGHLPAPPKALCVFTLTCTNP